MHAWVVVGRNQNNINSKVEELVAEIGGRRMEWEIAKIADVRELSKFVAVSLAEKTVMVIANIDQASTEAQSAFLKSLEEPQEKLSFVLTARDEDGMLATILSRCEIIRTGGAGEIKEESLEEAEKFLKLNKAEQLEKLSEIKGREEASEFVESLVVAGRERMNKGKMRPKQVEAMLSTLRNIKANGNVNLQLTNMVLGL